VAAAVSKPFTDGNWDAPDSGALLRTDPLDLKALGGRDFRD
jgi:hypothetical protein